MWKSVDSSPEKTETQCLLNFESIRSLCWPTLHCILMLVGDKNLCHWSIIGDSMIIVKQSPSYPIIFILYGLFFLNGFPIFSWNKATTTTSNLWGSPVVGPRCAGLLACGGETTTRLVTAQHLMPPELCSKSIGWITWDVTGCSC